MPDAEAAADLAAWRARITRPAGALGKASRAVQRRVNAIIPEKVHAAITAAMQAMTRAILTGADFVTASPLHAAINVPWMRRPPRTARVPLHRDGP